MNRIADRFDATLRHQAAEGDDSARIAGTAAAAWRNVDAALSPIIGKSAVTALLRRSVLLTARTYPWIAAVAVENSRIDRVEAVRKVLSEQKAVDAAAANGALLQTFCDLLDGLIGAPLTERLLQSAGDGSSGGLSDQDRSP